MREGQPLREAGLLAFAQPPSSQPRAVDTTTPLSIQKPAAAPAPARERERVGQPSHQYKFPPVDAPDLDAAWDDFFSSNKPPAHFVSGHMLKLNAAGHHRQVIAALRAALINGQAQPWMYQALAGSMEIEKYPREEVERVLLSMTDFGQADFQSMMLSAAFLVRFERHDTALGLYRQASRMQPESPEPYILSLAHAGRLKNADDVLWAATGVLRYDWTSERGSNVTTALAVIAMLERELERAGNLPALDALRAAVAEARAIDLEVEVVWNGNGDLDLEVEEPSGSVCSLTNPQTGGGGYHLGDGYGPRPQDCRETYLCPTGFNGTYRIRLKHSFGTIVGQRATVTITTHKGQPTESRETRTVVFQDGVASLNVELEQGRRQQFRVVQESRPVRQAITRRPAARAFRDSSVIPAAAQGGPSGAVIGAIGFQPNVQVINEGVSLGVSALISPDRRYVRLGISPVFSNITDIFTFSVFGGSPTAGGAAPQNR